MELSTYKSPSKILFEVGHVEEEKRPRVKEAKRGDVFALRSDRVDNPVCMLVDVSIYRAFDEDVSDIESKINKSFFVVNLQTGRVFSVGPETEIEWLRVRMVVDGVKEK